MHAYSQETTIRSGYEAALVKPVLPRRVVAGNSIFLEFDVDPSDAVNAGGASTFMEWTWSLSASSLGFERMMTALREAAVE